MEPGGEIIAEFLRSMTLRHETAQETNRCPASNFVLSYWGVGSWRLSTMMQIAPRIVLDERIHAGKPVIAGTRVPVEVVLGVLATGESMERIMDEYRIQKEDILAA